MASSLRMNLSGVIKDLSRQSFLPESLVDEHRQDIHELVAKVCSLDNEEPFFMSKRRKWKDFHKNFYIPFQERQDLGRAWDTSRFLHYAHMGILGANDALYEARKIDEQILVRQDPWSPDISVPFSYGSIPPALAAILMAEGLENLRYAHPEIAEKVGKSEIPPIRAYLRPLIHFEGLREQLLPTWKRFYGIRGKFE